MKKKMKVHFMGIGGSALSGVAVMAKNRGFIVTGCDLEKNTAYLKQVKKEGIKVYVGHDKKHIEGTDILAVSPAIYYRNTKHSEFLQGKERDIVVTWDKFVGKYLLNDKETICITGTHGKSSTTALASRVFEEAGLDPSVIVGAKVKAWEKNYRAGKGKYFILEADDFYEKFLNYKPSTIILNNIEYDHPDFFESENDMLDSYERFVKLLKKGNSLIVNLDSQGNKKLLKNLKKNLKNINVYGYSLGKNKGWNGIKNITASISEKTEKSIKFMVYSDDLDVRENYSIEQTGEYNVANALGVIILSILYSIDQQVVRDTLKGFKGTGRRMELIGEKRGIKVYDDYAHHPTAIAVTLRALRQKYSSNRIWVVNEPHSYSRTKALLGEYAGVFKDADKVLIGPIFKARDKKKFGVNGYSIVKASKHSDIRFVPTSAQIAAKLKKEVNNDDVIIVMGAGESYKWAREILKKI